MLYKLLDTFRVFPYSMLWLLFEIYSDRNTKKQVLLCLIGMMGLLHYFGLSLLSSFIIVGLVAEIAVRIFISTVIFS